MPQLREFMRAARISAFGDVEALRLRRVPVPTTASGQVLVALRAAWVGTWTRPGAPIGLRGATLLPPFEIEAAVNRVLEENGALSRDDLPRAVALLFGFQRTGPEFRPVVLPVIDAILNSGLLSESAAGLVLGAVG